MEGSGRKSVGVLALVSPLPGQRLEPPETLTVAQKATWRAVVATKPPEWFAADSAPVLIAYCKAVETYSHLSALVEKYQAKKRLNLAALKAYGFALAAQEKQAKLIAMLATKMRLVQQSRYTTQSAGTADRRTANTEKKPWEFGKTA